MPKPPNPNGNPGSLQASHPGNLNAAKSGIWSKRARAPRAAEVTDALMELPHTTPIDVVAACVVADLYALHEALAGEMQKAIVRLEGEDTEDRGRAPASPAWLRWRSGRPAQCWRAWRSSAGRPRARHRRDHQMGETLAEQAKRIRDKAGA